MAYKIDVYYFSGTDNTKAIVDSLSKRLADQNYEVDIFLMEKGFKNPFNKTTKIVFAFPANSQVVSPLVWRFFKSLPKGNGTEIFMLTTLRGRKAL